MTSHVTSVQSYALVMHLIKKLEGRYLSIHNFATVISLSQRPSYQRRSTIMTFLWKVTGTIVNYMCCRLPLLFSSTCVQWKSKGIQNLLYLNLLLKAEIALFLFFFFFFFGLGNELMPVEWSQGCLSTIAKLQRNAAKYVENMHLLLFLNILKMTLEKKVEGIMWKNKVP